MKHERGLADVNLADLEIVIRALEDEDVRVLDMALLRNLALGHLVDPFVPLLGQAAETVRIALRLIVAERCHHPAPHLELVWTGPEAGLRPARDTSVVVRELFGRARRRVLVGGFSFDHGGEILEPLHRAMNERGVEAVLFLNVKRAGRRDDPAVHTSEFIARFLAENWPFGQPHPSIYYDPRTVSANSVTSLHAKCVVVDDRWSFVSSANFTNRGLERNLETGVLIEDPLFTSRLTEQWLSLVESGQMQPYLPVGS